MAQAGYKVQVRTLQIAPILFTIRPYHTEAGSISVTVKSSCMNTIDIVFMVIDFQERASRTFLVFCEIRIISNEYFIVLE